MKKKSMSPQTNAKACPSLGFPSGWQQAVVIGGGIAGLSAARVLAGYFEQVTLVDRDHLPLEAEFRKGAPQAYHAHTLQARGQAILEAQFPGLMNELVAGGAIEVDSSREVAFYEGGGWKKPSPRKDDRQVVASRPLLESAIRRRVAANPGVCILEGHEVVELLASPDGAIVAGVRVRPRLPGGGEAWELPASLVLDASGRNSQAVRWLRKLGYPVPQETVLDAGAGYASQIFHIPAGLSTTWKMLYVRPEPPVGTRGGVILPLEGGRWHVSLMGLAGDYPPTDEDGFMEFARSVPTGQLYEAIRDAEPVGRVHGFRRTENRMRHYENMDRYLEGFLVMGDAVFTLNPVYALGMTASALAGQALGDSLEAQLRRGKPDMQGLAADFQSRQRRAVERPWSLVMKHDRLWAAAMAQASQPAGRQLANALA